MLRLEDTIKDLPESWEVIADMEAEVAGLQTEVQEGLQREQKLKKELKAKTDAHEKLAKARKKEKRSVTEARNEERIKVKAVKAELKAELKEAKAATKAKLYEEGKANAATRKLEDFQKGIENLVKRGVLTATDGQHFIDSADDVIAQLGG